VLQENIFTDLLLVTKKMRSFTWSDYSDIFKPIQYSFDAGRCWRTQGQKMFNL